MFDYVSVSAKCLTELQTATNSDKQLCPLMTIIMSGWSDDKKSMREDLKSYYTFREEMSVLDGLIFKGDKIVVPTSMQTDIKERIHSSHVGVHGCLRRARDTVYWPNMNADFESYISRCSTCNSIQRSQAKEPMIAHAIPELPWQHVACDLFECDGADYVVLVDYYSDFFEIDRLSDKRSNEVVRKLNEHIREAWLSGDPVFGQWHSAQFERLCKFCRIFRVRTYNEFAAIPYSVRGIGECRESSEDVDDEIGRCENRPLLGTTRTEKCAD